MNEVISSIQPNTAEKKPHECKCTKNNGTAEYGRLIGELKEKIKISESAYKERIESTIKEYEDKLADKQLDYESVKRDFFYAREENSRLQQKVYDSSYTIENQKNRLGKIAKENEKLEEENKLLRKLVKEWA